MTGLLRKVKILFFYSWLTLKNKKEFPLCLAYFEKEKSFSLSQAYFEFKKNFSFMPGLL